MLALQLAQLPGLMRCDCVLQMGHSMQLRGRRGAVSGELGGCAWRVGARRDAQCHGRVVLGSC